MTVFTDLHGGDFWVVISVEQGDGLPAQHLLHVALLVELGVDQLGGGELGQPGLGAGVEVTAGHAQGHGQAPVLGLSPAELVLLHDVGQLGLVREEQGQVGGENTGLHRLENLVVLLIVQVLENVI